MEVKMKVLIPKDTPEIDPALEVLISDSNLIVPTLESIEEQDLIMVRGDKEILQLVEKIYTDCYYLIAFPGEGLYPTAKEMGLSESNTISYEEVLKTIENFRNSQGNTDSRNYYASKAVIGVETQNDEDDSSNHVGE